MHEEILDSRRRVLFPLYKCFKGFYLVGGTALALQLGHRDSYDFDLFTDKPLPKSLLSKVQRIFYGKKIVPLVSNSQELTMLIDEVKTTFFYYPFPTILPLVSLNGLSALGVKELAVTKAYAIGRRGKYRDYFDLYAILKAKAVTLQEIIRLADKKYGDIFNARLFLEQLLDVVNMEDTDITIIGRKISPAVVVKSLSATVAKFKL